MTATTKAQEHEPVEVSSLAYLLAATMAGAGAIHLAMVPTHAGESLLDGLGFAVAGWFQLAIAGFILARRTSPALYVTTVVGNLVLVSLWLVSRTVGLPVGGHSGIVEQVSAIDASAVVLQISAVVLSLVLLRAPAGHHFGLGPAIAGMAVLALATTVIVSPDASEHGHSHDTGTLAATSTAGHDHGGATTVSAGADDMAIIDESRCDYGFNPQGYWDEAAYLGVDTYAGGAMDASHHGASDSVLSQVTGASVNGGRGSAQLDALIATTEKASQGEAASAALVTQLGAASDQDYRDWLSWLRSSGTLGHSHTATTTGDDTGHGGHMGPQPWKAMVDQSQCDQLAEEIGIARDVALAHPTAADAMADGWMRVTGYVPGIAAHYMKFSLVDGTFEVDKPEMLLYDGSGPDAHIVGLSYYILHEANAEPTQGFSGDNDHFHRHVGLCVGVGGVIGDSTLTDEECAAIGGRKQEGDAGWMSHAWVVPGCESPWGVFSAASPLLDRALSDASGQNEGGCVASGVRDRWDMSEATGSSVNVALGDDTEEATGD